MPTQWFIGCSGFSYPEWKEKFYPKGLPSSKWFEHYCTRFNALELNVTFYRFPQLRTLEGWYRRSPENFTFSVKAPRSITHFKQFKEAHKEVEDFFKIVRFGLKEKLGTILFQTPPKFAYSEAALQNILSHLHPEATNVIEFRNQSWWMPEVWEALAAHNITFSGTSYPGLPDDIPEAQATGYFRLHGVPHLYHSPYNEAYIQKIKRRLATANRAFVFFDNTASGAAIDNAFYLQQITAEN